MKQKETTQLNKSLKAISAKVVLLGVTLILILSCAVYLTFAWYTKMVSVMGLEFKTAEWEFTANNVTDDMYVNVYQYKTINVDEVFGPLAAPGTKGYIPITLGAWQSDTDIEFTLTIDRSTMSEDFQRRIFFYYCTDENGNLSNVETANKHYLHGSPSQITSTTDLKTIPISKMTGTVVRNGERDIVVFWEWVYEAYGDFDKDAWDEFDSKVGMNPTIYEEDMNARMTISGVEVVPTNGTIYKNPTA